MAAAHVTGAAALYLAQNPTASPAQVIQALLAQASDFVTGAPSSTTTKSVWVGEDPMGSTETLEVRIASSSDDSEEFTQTGETDVTSSDLELGDNWNASTLTTDMVGMRFRSLSIPQGATITNAYIQFTVDELDSGAANLTLRGQDSNDAGAFSWSWHDISSRPTTSASVAWAPPAWTSVGAAGADQRTPNLSAIIQEIVNRGGWSSGNDLVLLVTGTGVRTAESYNGSSSKAPLLHIEYQD